MKADVVRLVVLVLVVGLATGRVTQFGQSVLPDGWSQAANAISPWLLVAFLVGSAMPGWRAAAIAGSGTLVLALVGYYAATTLRFGIGGGTPSLVFWGLGAVVGGPVFGGAGWWWRHDHIAPGRAPSVCWPPSSSPRDTTPWAWGSLRSRSAC
jgi:hypothetical protein